VHNLRLGLTGLSTVSGSSKACECLLRTAKDLQSLQNACGEWLARRDTSGRCSCPHWMAPAARVLQAVVAAVQRSGGCPPAVREQGSNERGVPPPTHSVVPTLAPPELPRQARGPFHFDFSKPSSSLSLHSDLPFLDGGIARPSELRVLISHRPRHRDQNALFLGAQRSPHTRRRQQHVDLAVTLSDTC